MMIFWVPRLFGIENHDCLYISTYKNYLRSEVVFLAEIEKKCNGTNNQWKIKILEKYKGTPFKIFQEIRGKFHEGDKLLIYGYNNQIEKYTGTYESYCYKSIILIDRKQKYRSAQRDLYFKWSLYHKEKYKHLNKVEIEILKMCKKYVGENGYTKIPIFNEKIEFDDLEDFKIGLSGVWGINKKVKRYYLRIRLTEGGRNMELKFLNRFPRKLKKAIKNYYENGDWSIIEENKGQDINIIQCYLTPKKMMSMDF